MDGIVDINLVSVGIRTLSMLSVVLAFLLVVLFLFKRFSNSRGNNKDGTRIKLLSSIPLSTKNKLQVVDIDGEKIVIGVSPGNINFITKINTTSCENNKSMARKNEKNV